MRVAQPNEKEISHGRQSRALLPPHTSYFIIHHCRAAACRWLHRLVRRLFIRRWYGVRSVYHWAMLQMDTRYSMGVLSHSQAPRNYNEHRTLFEMQQTQARLCSDPVPRINFPFVMQGSHNLRNLRIWSCDQVESPNDRIDVLVKYRRRLDDPFNSRMRTSYHEDQSFGCLNCQRELTQLQGPGRL